MLVERLFVLAGILVAAGWAAFSALVVAQRLRRDRRRRRIRRVRERLLATLERLPRGEISAAALGLGRIGLRTLVRIAADPFTPPALAEILAVESVHRDPRRIVRDARGRAWTRPSRRIAALRVLVRARHPLVLTLLTRAAYSADSAVAEPAVALLGSLPDRKAAEILIDALKKGALSPTLLATHLDRFPLDIPDLILSLLTAPEKSLRAWGASLAARYPNASGFPLRLNQLVADTDPTVRMSAFETLASAGTPGAIRAGVALLDDSVGAVRAHAARVLGTLGRPSLARHIALLLCDREWWVRLAAREALETLGPAVTPVLDEYRRHPDRFARDGAAEVLENLGVASPDGSAR